jgi:hypothetical protein
MIVDNSDPRAFSGQTLYDTAGQAIGRVADIHEDGLNPHTFWCAVDLSGDPGDTVMVPGGDIRAGREGPTLPFTRAVVVAAPRARPSSGEVSGREARALYEHYAGSRTTLPPPPKGEEATPSLPPGGEETAPPAE